MKERQHWGNSLGSDYQDQLRKVILLTLALSGRINNSIEICISPRELDKYTEIGDMNKTKVWLQVLHMTVCSAAKIIKDMYKAPPFQLRIQTKKVAMKEEDQQYKYAGYSVSNVVCMPKTVLFHIKPK